MRARTHSNAFLLVVALLLGASIARAGSSAPTRHHLVLSIHGTRALNGDGSKEAGWGGGGSVRYSVVNGLKLWSCVERVRTARDGSTSVSTATPWTVGVDLGPRASRRIDPFFRIGLGMYRLHLSGEYWNFITRQTAPFSDSGLFSGLNIGGGGYAKLTGGTILELSATFHQSFTRRFSSDAPSAGDVQLVSFRAGLGYPIR